MSFSDIEYFGKLNPRRLTTLSEDFRKEQAEILADQAHWKKYGKNRCNSIGKQEIKEELSRERFPSEG